MKSWKKEIKILGNDFGLPGRIAREAIAAAEAKSIPDLYNGNPDGFRYDVARNVMLPYMLGKKSYNGQWINAN